MVVGTWPNALYRPRPASRERVYGVHDETERVGSIILRSKKKAGVTDRDARPRHDGRRATPLKWMPAASR